MAMATNSSSTDRPAATTTVDGAQHTLSLGHGVGRAALIGVALGFVVLATLATAVASIAGLEPLEALGVGSFTALWGGPGFGAMFGAITAITRNERAEALAVAGEQGRVAV